jgi:hypothetical protein
MTAPKKCKRHEGGGDLLKIGNIAKPLASAVVKAPKTSRVHIVKRCSQLIVLL